MGSDVLIFVLKPQGEWTVTQSDLQENCHYTPYEGFPMKGKIRDVLMRGHHKLASGKIVIDEADGRYLERGLPDLDIR